jgi:ABC-type sugar transport system ATPase subunit
MTLGDRIVIMKDGFVQQVGTAQEVFAHPANLFVAGFIGMPRMNLFDAELVKEDGKYFVDKYNIKEFPSILYFNNNRLIHVSTGFCYHELQGSNET